MKNFKQIIGVVLFCFISSCATKSEKNEAPRENNVPEFTTYQQDLDFYKDLPQ